MLGLLLWDLLSLLSPHSIPLPALFCFQVTFSLTSGNIGRVFEIRTTNNTYGEVFVARPLDRERLDHYTLWVSTPLTSLGGF